MSEVHPQYVRCASDTRAFLDCEVSQIGGLIRVLGYVPMDFTPEDAARLGQILLAWAWDDAEKTLPESTPAPVSGDAIVDETIQMLLARSRLGQAKYGTTLMRNDLSLLDWMRHAIEESLDRTLYLLRALKDLEKLYLESAPLDYATRSRRSASSSFSASVRASTGVLSR